jgi:hypothetical protein
MTMSLVIIAFGALLMLWLAMTYRKDPPIAEKPKDSRYICVNCLAVGKKVEKANGHWFIGALLFIAGVIPGLLYSAWRLSTIKHVCPCCGLESMIPVDSPRGRELASKI